MISTKKPEKMHFLIRLLLKQTILKRLALHSALLEFTLHDEKFSFEPALPKDLRATCSNCGSGKERANKIADFDWCV